MRDRSASLFWPLQLVGWSLLYAGLVASMLESKPLGSGSAEKGLAAVLGYALAEKGVTVVLGLLLTTAIWPFYRRLFRSGASLWTLLVVSVITSYFGSFVWNAGYVLTYRAVVAPLFREPPITLGDALGSVGLFSSVYNAPILLAWSILYFGMKYYQALLQERERTAAAQAEANEARLRALRYQLNPHFLFNTMNAISTLVVEERNDEAAAMIARLSDFLRVTLEGSDAPQVPLADEIEFARQYLEIEQIRFGSRLAVHIDVADDTLSLPVPTLILQPLVENSIKHAVAPSETGVRIGIHARRVNGTLTLQITDDGAGLDLFPGTDPEGIGLANTRARLHQLYGERQRLDLTGTPGGGLCVSIQIPLEPAASASGARVTR